MNENSRPVDSNHYKKTEKSNKNTCKTIKTPTINGSENRSERPLSIVAPIFTLNIDCFEEIFDNLSLKDMHSFGQTCRTLQKFGGDYFKRNYKSAEKFSANDGVYTVYSDESTLNERTQTSTFNQYINYISHYYDDFEPLRYIRRHSNEFESIEHIYLVCLTINAAKMKYLHAILPRIKVIQIRQCTLDGNFDEVLLKCCNNLKRLYIQDDLGDIIDETGNPWLLQHYPTLEHLQLTTRYPFRIHELSGFFRRNPNMRTFSTSVRCLWENRHELLECGTKFEQLEIQMLDNFYRDLIDVRSICDLLNQLHARGFYNRLHLYVKRADQKCSEHIVSLHGLESLSIRQFGECHKLAQLTDLKELTILDGTKATDVDTLANGLDNLERIFIQNATYNQMIPFICRSTKLNKFKIFPKDENCFNAGIICLPFLNREREKLDGARKVTVYVPDNVFLKTKWATKNGEINFTSVEMKRADSYEWNHHY